MESPSPLSFRTILARLAIILTLVAVIDFTLGLMLDRARNRCRQRESGLINVGRETRAEILILGSSRAKHHFDEVALSQAWNGRSVYNAGYSGQGLPFARVAFELIAQAKAPRLVIVDVMSFADDLDRVHAMDPWYTESARLRTMPGSDSSHDCVTAKQDWRQSLPMSMATYRYAGKAMQTLKDRYHFGEAPRFEPIPAKASPDLHGPAEAKHAYPRHAFQLAALVDEIRATGANVVFTFSPFTRAADCSQLTLPAQAVAREKGVPFHVFRSDTVPGLDEPKHFSDHVHLNGEGARIFTRHAANILRPYIPPTPSE